MRASPRKHTETQEKKKNDKRPKKVVDLEEEEFQGIEDVYAKGVDPMMRLPVYIPSWKGKTKVTKDPDTGKFSVSTPLLLE